MTVDTMTTTTTAQNKLHDVESAVHSGTLAGVWQIPHLAVKLPDGSTLLRPQKAVLWLRIKDCVKFTGVEAKTLNRLAECGILRRRRPSPMQSWFMLGEIFQFLERTEDPDYWDQVRRQAYLTGQQPTEARPLGKESGM